MNHYKLIELPSSCILLSRPRQFWLNETGQISYFQLFCAATDSKFGDPTCSLNRWWVVARTSSGLTEDTRGHARRQTGLCLPLVKCCIAWNKWPKIGHANKYLSPWPLSELICGRFWSWSLYFLLKASFGLLELSLAASICVHPPVCPCVHHEFVHAITSPVSAEITNFGHWLRSLLF